MDLLRRPGPDTKQANLSSETSDKTFSTDGINTTFSPGNLERKPSVESVFKVTQYNSNGNLAAGSMEVFWKSDDYSDLDWQFSKVMNDE